MVNSAVANVRINIQMNCHCNNIAFDSDIYFFFQVGRWSALAFGLFYGYTHNISLQKQAEQKKVESEYHRKELLIEQARLAYAKKQSGVVETPAKTVACKFFDF